VELDSERLDVVRSVRTSGEVRQIELNLIPTFVETHGHGADKGLHARGGLVVGGAETSADTLVVQNLNLKSKVLLQVLDDHNEERKLDAKGLICVSWAADEARVDVAPDKLQHGGLDVLIRQALDVAVAYLLVPDLQRPRSNAVQNRKET